ncbi:MAG: metallophosphoesterase family protein [Dehalococcoidia bacterium]|nr:metallophosphoesterase family protein [Dehalococcoidia bacterium]
MRIAVISDTHELGAGWGSPPELLDALRGVDLILHCGDLEVLGILDHLETVAPVLAVRGYPDPHELRPAVGSLDRVGQGERLADRTRVVQMEGLRIGMVHDIQWPGPRVQFATNSNALEFPPGSVPELMERKFGQPVDVVCFGDTHVEYVGWHQNVLFVNPGSTSSPATLTSPAQFGTLAYLNVSNGVVSVEIRPLHRNT